LDVLAFLAFVAFVATMAREKGSPFVGIGYSTLELNPAGGVQRGVIGFFGSIGVVHGKNRTQEAVEIVGGSRQSYIVVEGETLTLLEEYMGFLEIGQVKVLLGRGGYRTLVSMEHHGFIFVRERIDVHREF